MEQETPTSEQVENQLQSPETEATQHETDIAIIGGGIAGLYCGYRLWEENNNAKVSRKREFRIFEESDHLGGRIWSTRILANGFVVPQGDTVNNDKRGGFEYQGEGWKEPEPLEFCAEFGPMRIELDVQKCLATLLLKKLKLSRKDDLEKFPPYESPTSEHDPKYELKGEECDQETPLDLLKLAIVRVMGRLHSRENGAVRSSADDPIKEQKKLALDRKLEELVHQLSSAMATRQASWKDVLRDWIRTLKEFDYQNMRENGIFYDGTDRGTPLWDMGFWNLLSEVLSHHAVLKLRDLGTFYHLIPENPNAAEWLIFWLRGFSTSEHLVGVRGGMQRITEMMAQAINADKKHILPRHKLRGIKREGTKIRLTFADDAGKKVEDWLARHVILALPRGPLDELVRLNADEFYNQLPRDLGAVFGFPLLKLFLVVKERWWNEDAARTNRYATLIPTREVHYRKSLLKDSRKGLILVYTDRPATNFWSNYLTPGEDSQREAGATPSERWRTLISSGFQRIPEHGVPDEKGHLENLRLVDKALQYLNEYGVKIGREDIEFYGIRDWGREPYLGAAHAWYPERQSWQVLRRLSAFAAGSYSHDDNVPSSDPKVLHICGEAYSDYQAFIEGALRSAEHVLHMIDPEIYTESPTPWLCDQHCRYDKDPGQEILRLKGEKDCVRASTGAHTK
jgi:monoamine oxidase